MVGVMLENPVRRRVSVDDDVAVPLFFGLVYVLGRRNWEQSQRGA